MRSYPESIVGMLVVWLRACLLRIIPGTMAVGIIPESRRKSLDGGCRLMRIWDPRLGKSSLLAKRARATTIARKVSLVREIESPR